MLAAELFLSFDSIHRWNEYWSKQYITYETAVGNELISICRGEVIYINEDKLIRNNIQYLIVGHNNIYF